MVAEIRAAGYGSMQDINQNMQSDYLDALEKIQKSEQFQQTMDLQSNKESNRMTNDREKAQIEREKLQAQRDIAEKQLQIAQVNKNKFDKKPSDKKK